MKKTYFGMPEYELVKIMQQGGSEQTPTDQTAGGNNQTGANSNPACAALQQALPNLPAELQTPAKNALQTGQCEQFIQMLQQQAQGEVNTQQAPMMAGGGKDYSVYFGMPESQLEKIQNLAEYSLAIIAQSGVKENLQQMRNINKLKREKARELRKEARETDDNYRKSVLRQSASEWAGSQYTIGDKLKVLFGVNLDGLTRNISLLDALLGNHSYKNSKKSKGGNETKEIEETPEIETKQEDEALKKTIQDKLMEKVNENGTSKDLMDFIRNFKVEIPEEKSEKKEEVGEKEVIGEGQLFKKLKAQNPDLTYNEFLEKYMNEKPKERAFKDADNSLEKEVVGEGQLFKKLKQQNPNLTYNEFLEKYMNEKPKERAFKDADNSLENAVKQSMFVEQPNIPMEQPKKENKEGVRYSLGRIGSLQSQIYQEAIEQFANKLAKRFEATNNDKGMNLVYDLVTDAKRAGDNEKELYDIVLKIIALDEKEK
jgi:hypothetical protein